jgi:hypothetical protein
MSSTRAAAWAGSVDFVDLGAALRAIERESTSSESIRERLVVASCQVASQSLDRVQKAQTDPPKRRS